MFLLDCAIYMQPMLRLLALQESRRLCSAKAQEKLLGSRQVAHHSLCNRTPGRCIRSDQSSILPALIGSMCLQQLSTSKIAAMIWTPLLIANNDRIHLHWSNSLSVHAGQVKWSLEFCHVASPVARLLLPEADGTSGVFALFGKVGRSPRVYASRDRDALLKQLQTAAYKKMGLTLAGGQETLHSYTALLHRMVHTAFHTQHCCAALCTLHCMRCIAYTALQTRHCTYSIA